MLNTIEKNESVELTWDQLPSEPDLWFSRFTKYARRLGYEYTIVKAYRLFSLDQKGGTAEGAHVWTKYASEWKWADRAKAYAEWQAFYGEMQWHERRLQIREEDYKVANKLRDVADQIISRAPEFIKTSRVETVDPKTKEKVIILRQELKLDVAIRALEAASKVSRLSAELESDRQVVTNDVTVKGYAIVSPDDWPSENGGGVQAPAVADSSVEVHGANAASNG